MKYGIYMVNPEYVLFENNNVMRIRNRPWYDNL